MSSVPLPPSQATQAHPLHSWVLLSIPIHHHQGQGMFSPSGHRSGCLVKSAHCGEASYSWLSQSLAEVTSLWQSIFFQTQPPAICTFHCSLVDLCFTGCTKSYLFALVCALAGLSPMLVRSVPPVSRSFPFFKSLFFRVHSPHASAHSLLSFALHFQSVLGSYWHGIVFPFWIVCSLRSSFMYSVAFKNKRWFQCIEKLFW